MTIEATVGKLVELTGALAQPGAENFKFNSIIDQLSAIRGGELFVIDLVDPIAIEQQASLALERGAAAVLASKRFNWANLEKDRCLLVDNLSEALIKVGLWWYQRFNTTVYLLCRAGRRSNTRDYLAALLLTNTRGIYPLAVRPSMKELALSLCRVGAEHNWVMLELAQQDRIDHSNCVALSALNVQQVILEGLPEGSKLHDLLVQFNKAQFVIDRDVLAWTNALGLPDAATIQAADLVTIKNDDQSGFNGHSLTVKVNPGEFKLRLKQLGTGVVNSLRLALSAATAVSRLDISAIKTTLERIPLNEGYAKILHLKGNRLLAWIALEDQEAVDLVNELLRTDLNKLTNWGVIVSSCASDLTGLFTTRPPEFVIVLPSAAGQAVEHWKSTGSKLFQVDSPAAAAHTALKIPTQLILLLSTEWAGIEATWNIVVEQVGVVSDMPPSANGSSGN